MTTHSIPPYVPYRTFVTFVDSLRVGVPSHVDKSVLMSMSGGVRAWLKASLRSMELIDGASVPQERLHRLAAAEGVSRQRLLRTLFTSTYSFLLPTVDLRLTTPAKLEAAFVARGASGDTVRKSIAFMLAMAKDAGVELSPHLTKRGAMSHKLPQGASRRKIGHANSPASAPEDQHDQGTPTPRSPLAGDWLARLLDKFPEFDPAWNDELKAKWFEAFQRLMSAQAE